jgi:hypothetical protein
MLQDATLKRALMLKGGKLPEHSGARVWPGTLKPVRCETHHSKIIKDGADPSGAGKILCSTTQPNKVRVCARVLN